MNNLYIDTNQLRDAAENCVDAQKQFHEITKNIYEIEILLTCQESKRLDILLPIIRSLRENMHLYRNLINFVESYLLNYVKDIEVAQK